MQKDESKQMEYAKALTRQGWELFVIKNCGWCNKQLGDFGTAQQYLRVYPCDTKEFEAKCTYEKVKTVPQWINKYDQRTKVGYVPIENMPTIFGLP